MSRFHALTVSDVQRATRDAVVVRFAVPPDAADVFRFTQGQHVTLRTHLEGHELRRSYSICSAVQDGDLRVAVKRVPGGAFSNWLNDCVHPGQQIDVMPPTGQFHVPIAPTVARHHLAFAAGSGITPIFSIVKTMLLAEPHSRFTLIYGNRATSSVLLREELAELKDRFVERLQIIYVMSREQQDIELFNGRIDRPRCEALVTRLVALDKVDTVLLCGPAGMNEAVRAVLAAHGVPASKIKSELFVPGTPAPTSATRTRSVEGDDECQVTVQIDGTSRQFTVRKGEESVLDAALRQGIDLPYSCKGGVCSTCRCKVVEGEVEMHANFALEDYEVARRYVLSCQSHPVTDRLTIDYDQPV
jgi:ring-1,2-phenylacetyl-CoA epoxidase subunit PaaE